MPNPLSDQRTPSGRQAHSRLDAAGIITLLAVMSFLLLSYSAGDPRRWLAVACLLVFTVVLYLVPLGRGCRVATSTSSALPGAPPTPRAALPMSTPLWAGCWAAHLRVGLLVGLATLLTVLGANPIATIVLFFAISAAAFELVPRRQGFVWPVLCGAITIVMLGMVTGDLTYALFIGLGAMGGYFFIGSVTQSRMHADAANQESRRLLTELTEAHRQLQTYATQVETLAVAEERNRLSREMHDTLGHRLTVAAVQLEGAQRLIGNDPERARSMVATVREEIVEGLQELRQTVARLRTPLEADLRLPHALAKLGDGFAAATGIDVHLDIAAALPDLPPEHRQALFRAAQEALTNTQRHSGAANVWLSAMPCTEHPNCVCLVVEDDGSGINDEGLLRGYGLRGMRERADQLHGFMHLERNSRRGGAGIRVCLPLNGAPAEGGRHEGTAAEIDSAESRAHANGTRPEPAPHGTRMTP